MSKSRRALALTALACLALPLAGCSTFGTGTTAQNDTSESATEPNDASTNSCQAAAQTIDRVLADAQESAPQLVEDLLAGKSVDLGALIDPVFTSLDAAASGASDPAVASAIDDARTEWDGLASDIQGLGIPDLSGIDVSDLGSLGELGKLQTYGEDVSAIFSKRVPALQETGAALQKACSTAQ